MTIFTYLIGGFAALLFLLAWRERVAANQRDAGLLAGVAVCVGIGSITSALL